MDQIGPTSLQEKIVAKIQEQLGDLIEADDIRDLFKRTLHDAFAREREIKRDWNTVKMPPYMVEWVQEHAKAHVAKIVDEWLVAHPDELAKLVKETIQDGIAGAMLAAMERRMAAPLAQLAQSVVKTQQELVNKGLISTQQGY